MRIPAVCDNCGTLFPSPIEAGKSAKLTFVECKAGPCPRCGSYGHIPDGVYDFIENTIRLFSESRKKSELERLARILRKARDEGASLDQIGTSIQKEAPGISSLKDLLPKSRSDLYAFLSIVISLISLILQMKCPDHPKVEVNQVVNVIYQDTRPTEIPFQKRENSSLEKKGTKANNLGPKRLIPKKK
jgi:hypothetical protein